MNVSITHGDQILIEARGTARISYYVIESNSDGKLVVEFVDELCEHEIVYTVEVNNESELNQDLFKQILIQYSEPRPYHYIDKLEILSIKKSN